MGTRYGSSSVIRLYISNRLPYRSSMTFLPSRPGVGGILAHPDPSVVAQRLRRHRELRVDLVAGGDAGGVDLSETGVGEKCSFAMCSPDGRRVAGLGIGGGEEEVGVTAGGQHHHVSRVPRHLAGR